jgi:hypothetical protein
MSFDENHRLATRFVWHTVVVRDAFATLVRDRVKLDLRNWVDILSTSWKSFYVVDGYCFEVAMSRFVIDFTTGLALYVRSPAAAI